MSIKLVAALALIVLGIAALAYQGITYTTKGDAVDIGPMHIQTEDRHNIPLPPIVGAIALIGGIVLPVAQRTRRAAA